MTAQWENGDGHEHTSPHVAVLAELTADLATIATEHPALHNSGRDVTVVLDLETGSRPGRLGKLALAVVALVLVQVGLRKRWQHRVHARRD